MKEHPIPFTGPMVRAILDGRKTQTRRVIPKRILDNPFLELLGDVPHFLHHRDCGNYCDYACGGYFLCEHSPLYGSPGDRLWVKETWQHLQNQNNEWAKYLEPKRASECFYRADESDPNTRPISGRWRSPMFMPRWASRIILDVTAIRVEHVQDITEADAYADTYSAMHEHVRGDFAVLWDTLNAKRGYGWDANPWVWVIEFEVPA
jgi:hypothetical protein